MLSYTPNIHKFDSLEVDFLKVMSTVLLCWTTSEADVGGMAVGIEPFHQYSVTCFYNETDGRKGQSDMEVWMKQRCVTEFLYV